MRRLFTILLLLAMLAAALMLASRWRAGGDALVAQGYTVRTATIESTLELIGEVVNDRTVTMTALLDGELTAVHARAGDAVAANAVLATLDDRLARAEHERAVAEMDWRRASLRAIERDLGRLQTLRAANDISQQAIDDKRVELEAAAAAVRMAEAGVAVSQLVLDNATVRAPFAATVIEHSVEAGQWLEAGTPLFNLVAREHAQIEARVDAGDRARVRLGQVATVSSETWPEDVFVSAVDWIAPAVLGGQDSSVNNRFAIRLPIAAATAPLLHGQQLDVALLIEQREKALAVPLELIEHRSDGGLQVWMQDNEGRATPREIGVGLRNRSMAEVLSGLESGETILAPRARWPREGERLQMLDAPYDPAE